MSRLIASSLSCPVCGSSDAGHIYHNNNPETGDDFYLFCCFSANHTDTDGVWKMPVESPDTYVEDILNPEVKEREEAPADEEHVMGLVDGGVYIDLKDPKHPWGARGITADTCRRFGVKYKVLPFTRKATYADLVRSKGLSLEQPALVFPNYNEKGQLIGQKTRTWDPYKEDRTFDWYKAVDDFNSQRTFFGQNLWLGEQWHGKKMVIVFGEFDALAFYQMMPGNYCVVSVPDGDTSLKLLVDRYYNWLNKFSEIIFIPDADGQCVKYAQTAAAKFPRKAKMVGLTRYKDPCDYLVHGDVQAFRDDFFSAQQFTPQKIVGLSTLKAMLTQDPPKPIATYPWEGLNDMTGGIWPGELVTLKAPPKIGKSTILNEIAYHLIQTTDHRIGMIYLEETQRDLVFRLVGMHTNRNLQRDQEAYKDPLIKKAFEELTQPERVFIVDHWGACSSDFIEEKITELVLASGCQYIFFDHVSMAITDESNKDERIALDRLIAAIKSLTVGIPDFDDNGKQVMRYPTIFMVTHVNDDGKPRGSRAALQLSNLVIGLDRDKMSKDPTARNITKVNVEDNRRFGDSGLACMLTYDKTTGRLSEVPTYKEGEDTPVFDNTKSGGYVHGAA